MPITQLVRFEALEWDSDMLGVSSGLIKPDLAAQGEDEANILLEVRKIVSECPDISFFVLKLPVRFTTVLNETLRSGATFIDTELSFEFKGSSSISEQPRVIFEKHVDPEPFLTMADEMKFSRFYMDSRIPIRNARRLWRQSIKNHCTGLADELVTTFIGHQPAGLVTLNFVGSNMINLHIVGVYSMFHRKGVASAMIQAIQERYGPQHGIRVECHASNAPAVAFYQKMGFKLSAMSHVIHIWRGDSPKADPECHIAEVHSPSISSEE
jgi:GNAT superfamily N-acetyltransferase